MVTGNNPRRFKPGTFSSPQHKASLTNFKRTGLASSKTENRNHSIDTFAQTNIAGDRVQLAAHESWLVF